MLLIICLCSNKIIKLFNIFITKDNKCRQNEPNKYFFFENNQEDLEYCKNYGIMIYNYHERKIHLSNIGDYIQSLAALQFLPKNCKPYLIDRDFFQFYQGQKVKLILNGWHKLHDSNKYIPEQISPIFISYHLNSKTFLPSIYVDTLKKYSPIGCRDISTKKQFDKYGIKSYFSSCLTTTLDVDYSISPKIKRNNIIFIDYNFGDFIKADRFLYSLKAYNFKKTNIIHIHHSVNVNMTYIEKFKLAKTLLNKYARAKLIISTRIHGALPCLALKTPVIFINKKYDYKRFPGLYELLNTIGINYKNKFEIRVNINDKGFVFNSGKYLLYANKLKKKLQYI